MDHPQTSVKMKIQENRIRLEDLPKTEQQIVNAYLPLIKELFLIASPNGVNSHFPTDIEFHGNLKRFLEMFVAIFRNTTVITFSKELAPNDEVIQHDAFLEQRMKIFRDVYRRYYRNVHYLSSSRIEQARQHAENRAIGLIPPENDLLPQLRKLISLEGRWIAQINSCKRTKIIDSIRIDTIADLRAKIMSEFPLLYRDNKTDFYEEKWFVSQRVKMLGEAKEDLKDQTPYGPTEDSYMILLMTATFEMEANKNVVTNLVARNAENRKNVGAIMQVAVDTAVDNYTKDMTAFLESVSIGQYDAFLDRHVKVKEECAPKFENYVTTENSGVPDVAAQFTRQYEQEVEVCFRKIVEEGENKAKNALQQLEEKGIMKLANFIQDYKELYEGFDLPQTHVNQIQEQMGKVIGTALDAVKKGSLADLSRIGCLVHQVTPKNFLTLTAQHTDHMDSLKKYKRQYRRKIHSFIKDEKKSFEEVNSYQENVKEDLTKEIKIELTGKLGGSESYDDYISEFCTYTERYWTSQKSNFPVEEQVPCAV